MPTWLIIVITACSSYLLSLVVRVLTSREKKINHKIEHLYSVEDEQFLRSIGRARPWTEKLKETAAGLFRSQL